MGAPPPCARRLAGTSLPIAPPLLMAPLLRALSPLNAVRSPALLPAELLRLVRVGSWTPLHRLCDRSWALRRLSLCRARWLPGPVSCLSMLLCCLLLCCAWRPVVSYALTRYAPCGSWALCCPSLCAHDRSPALCGIFQVCCIAFCSATPGVPMSRMPRLVGASPSLVPLPVGSSLLIALPLSVAPLLRAPSLGCCIASCSTARGAPLLPLP